MNIKTGFGLITFAMAWSCLACADESTQNIDLILDMQFENLVGVKVTTASKVEETAQDAPAAVHVVTAESIRSFGYRTLGDILRSMPGLQSSYDRSYQHLGVRGINRKDFNERVLLLINGQRFNENMYDSAVIDRTFMIEVDAIERVEFVSGPGSSMYGNNAMLGVINVITKTGKSIDGLRVAGAGGSYDSARGYVEFGKRFDNGANVMVASSGFRSDGENLYFKEQDELGNNGGHVNNLDGEKAGKVFGSFSYEGLDINVGAVERNKDIPTAPYSSQFAPPQADINDYQRFISGHYRRELNNELYGTLRTSFGAYDFHNNYYYAKPLNQDRIEGRWWTAELKLEYTGLDRHRLVGGFEVQNNLNQNYQNTDISPRYHWYDQNGDSIKYGFFINDHIHLHSQWQLDLGVRVDRYDSNTAIRGCSPESNPQCSRLIAEDHGVSTNPRAALIYKPFDSTVFKALYGSAYRAPNPTEIGYVVPPSATVGNAKPEKFTTYELIAEYFLHENFKLWSNVFQNDLHGVIDIPDDTFTNTGDIRSRGFGLGLEWRTSSHQRLFSSYTNAHATDPHTHQRLDDAPLHNLKLGYSTPLFDSPWHIGGDAEYISSRKTPLSGDVSGYILANLTLSSDRLWKHVDFSASIYNILDSEYQDPARGSAHAPIQAIPQTGRSFRIEAGYHF